jgi:diaminopimelate decarboxylase
MIYKKNNLTIDGFDVGFLARKFNTPIYCYSMKKIKENILNLKYHFKKIDPLICYAVKANTNINILKEIKNHNLGADVVSIGELMKALKAGIQPHKIVFSGVGKTTTEIEYAVGKKILLINAESKSEILEIEKIAKRKKKSC